MEKEEQKLAVEGFSKLYLASLISWAKKSPEEFAESYGEHVTENIKLRIDLGKLIAKINKIEKCIDNLKPLTEEETGIKEMLKLAYKEDNIKNLETSFKTICHLEDFEIAIWNIKDILKDGEKDD